MPFAWPGGMRYSVFDAERRGHLTDEVKQEPDTSTAADFEPLVRHIGLVFSNVALYGLDHSVTTRSIETAYETVSRLLEKHNHVSFGIVQDEVVVNRHTIPQKSPPIRHFHQQLEALGASDFVFQKGLAPDDFVALVKLMIRKPEQFKESGGFVSALASTGLHNITAKRVTYREIAEDEVVVAKDALGGDDAAGGAAAEQKLREIEDLLAFLKTATQSVDKEQIDKLPKLPVDVSELAELVSAALELRTESGEAGEGVSEGKAASDCLRRVFDKMAADPALRTQKGKKGAAKTLTELEEKVVHDLKEADRLSEDDEQEIGETVQSLKDELAIEALASEYMKKRKAIETNERRILRFIRSKGVEGVAGTDLETRLSEAGLAPDEWADLVAMSGAADEDDGEDWAGLPAPDIAAVAGLLSRMQQVLPAAEGPPSPDAESTIKEVRERVESLTSTAAQRIEALARMASKADRPMPGGKKQPGRKKLLEVLGELGQELCQPLSVLNCCIQMVVSNSLGEVNAQQVEMLRLAATSAETLTTLVNRLVEIAGLPQTRRPDAGIQQDLR